MSGFIKDPVRARRHFAFSSLSAVMLLGAAVIACPAIAASPAIGIAAVVDDQVISTLDVQDRLALTMGTAGIPDTPENRARLAPQIIHQLVDEKLQMEEATKLGITVNDAKLKEGIEQIEKQSNKPPGAVEQFIESHNLSKLSFYAQVRAQMAWAEIVIKKIRPRIRISDQEIARFVQHKEQASASTQEVQIATIQLPVDAPANEQNVKKLAEKLAGDIKAGASFEGVASQFSASTGGTKAADPFWVGLSEIDPALAQVLAGAPKGTVTDPVRTAAGYQIVKLIDTRITQNAPAASADTQPKAELAFKQIIMTLKPDAQPKEAQLLLGLAKEVQQSPGKCEDKSMAGAGDLGGLDFKVMLARRNSQDLPEKLRTLLMSLKVGQASDPVITPEGIRLFMLCERVDMPAGKTQNVQDDAARQAIFEQKMELEAQKYLRNLRREAFIETRKNG